MLSAIARLPRIAMNCFDGVARGVSALGNGFVAAQCGLMGLTYGVMGVVNENVNDDLVNSSVAKVERLKARFKAFADTEENSSNQWTQQIAARVIDSLPSTSPQETKRITTVFLSAGLTTLSYAFGRTAARVAFSGWR